MNTPISISVQKAFPGNPSKDLMVIPCLMEPKIAGKAVGIVPDYIGSFENVEQKLVFVPTCYVKEIHPNYIVCTRLIAESRGLL
jgi:hypothetical protein